MPVSSPPDQDLRRAGRMVCRAVVHTRADPTPGGGVVSRVARLRSQVPLVPRPTGPGGVEPFVTGDPAAARVALSTGAAGPVGGDRYELEVVVGAGSTLVLREVSATLVLPGPHGERSHTQVRVRVEEGATLVWVPEPLIAARRCDHEHDVRIDLADDARLFVREELVLGRHGESPGSLLTHLRVRRQGRPLVVQTLSLGPAAPGSGSAAVLGSHRGVGTVVVVDPAGHGQLAGRADDTCAVLPVDDRTLQVSALGVDGLDLRRRLDTVLSGLGPGLGIPLPNHWSAVPR